MLPSLSYENWCIYFGILRKSNPNNVGMCPTLNTYHKIWSKGVTEFNKNLNMQHWGTEHEDTPLKSIALLSSSVCAHVQSSYKQDTKQN